MDFSVLATSLQSTLGGRLPAIFGALGIIVVGWLAAVIARAAMRRILGLLKVDARIEESTGQKVGVETGIAVGVFWLIILIALVAVFDSLHLDSVSNPFGQMVAQIIGYAPRLVAGTILILLAWLVAISFDPVVSWLAHRGMRRGAATALVAGAVLALLAGFIALFGGILAMAQ